MPTYIFKVVIFLFYIIKLFYLLLEDREDTKVNPANFLHRISILLTIYNIHNLHPGVFVWKLLGSRFINITVKSDK